MYELLKLNLKMVKLSKSSNPLDSFRKKEKEREKQKNKQNRLKQKLKMFLAESTDCLLRDINNFELELKKANNEKIKGIIKLKKLVYNAKIMSESESINKVNLDPDVLIEMRDKGLISDVIVIPIDKSKENNQILKLTLPLKETNNPIYSHQDLVISYNDINLIEDEVFAEDYSQEKPDRKTETYFVEGENKSSEIKTNAMINMNCNHLLNNKTEGKLPPLPKEKRPKITLQDSYIKQFLQIQLQMKNQIQLNNHQNSFYSNLSYQSFLSSSNDQINSESDKIKKKKKILDYLNKIENDSEQKTNNKKDFTQKKRVENRFAMDPLDPYPKEKPQKSNDTTRVHILNKNLADKFLNVETQNDNSMRDNDKLNEITTIPTVKTTIQKPAEVYGIRNNILMTDEEKDKLVPHSIRIKQFTSNEKKNNKNHEYDEQEQFNLFLREINKN